MISAKQLLTKSTGKNQLPFYTQTTWEEVIKTIPFTTISKRIKHLDINLTKEVKDLYNENYKIVLRKNKIKETQLMFINSKTKYC